MDDKLEVRSKTVKMGDVNYDIMPKAASAGSKIISDMYIRLGRPENPFTPSGEKLMNIIIAVWEDLYPKEAKVWYDERRDYKSAELTISEQVTRRTGRSLASYPFAIYQIMRTVFPTIEPAERATCMKMIARWPMFQMANKV